MDDFITFIVGFFIGAIFFSIIVSFSIDNAWKTDAIKHDAGRFVVIDSTIGTTKFMWKDEIK